MAKKPQSFRIDEKKKEIIIYTNVPQVEAEKALMKFYLGEGYTAKTDEKKKGITVKEMEKELAADEKALAEFKAIYADKAKGKGFFGACKYYNNWKKNKK